MKKKLLILCILVFIVGICFAANTSIMPIDLAGDRVDPGAVQTARPTWVAIDTTLSAGDEPTDLAVTERTYQTVKAAQIADVGGDGKIAIYDVPRGWNAIRLRAQGITDNGTYTVQIYAGTLGDGKRDADHTAASTFDCELAYIGQFAWVIGTQGAVTATYEMADAVTVTESDWTVDMTAAGLVRSPGGERVAEVRFDLLGADLIVIVPTVVSADSKLLARGF
jgi:hypothetical protein